MANRTSSGLLLPLIVVVGLVAVFGGGKVLDAVESIFSGGDPVILVRANLPSWWLVMLSPTWTIAPSSRC